MIIHPRETWKTPSILASYKLNKVLVSYTTNSLTYLKYAVAISHKISGLFEGGRHTGHLLSGERTEVILELVRRKPKIENKLIEKF
jgi:hypothetical protein